MAIYKNVDYSTYTLQEIREVTALLVNKVLPGAEGAAKQIGLQQIDAIMAEFNLTVADLASKDKPRANAGVPVPMKYQNPSNPEDQWSGRGRAPKWVDDYEAVPGHTREDLLIHKAPAAETAGAL